MCRIPNIYVAVTGSIRGVIQGRRKTFFAGVVLTCGCDTTAIPQTR